MKKTRIFGFILISAVLALSGCKTTDVVTDDETKTVIEKTEDKSVKEQVKEEKPKEPKSNLASMGIYMFTWKTLKKYLIDDAKQAESSHDFGKNVIPAYLNDGLKLKAYRFKGYWKDVGTISSLWEANMDLLEDNNGLDLFDTSWKIYTDDPANTPQCIGENAKISNALVTQGAIVNGEVKHSVIFSEAKVNEGAVVTDSVVMNGAVIGKGAVLNRCLVMDEVRVPENAVLGSKDSEDILLVSKAYLAKEM